MYMSALSSKPIQIYLDKRQEQLLRRLAKERHVSVSELVRSGVNLLLEQLPLEDDPAWQLVGLGEIGLADLAVDHDRYLAEEIEREARR
jgi:hypothetical protein